MYDKQIALTITMIREGLKVPDNMKAKTIEHLKVIEMDYESGDAEQVILSMLIEAVNEEDADKLETITDLILAAEIDDDKPSSKRSEMVYQISSDAVNEWAMNHELASARIAILQRLLDNYNLIPVLTNNDDLLFYCIDQNCLIYTSVNNDKERDQVINDFKNLPSDKFSDVMDKIYQVIGRQAVETRFTKLNYEVIKDGKLVLDFKEV